MGGIIERFWGLVTYSGCLVLPHTADDDTILSVHRPPSLPTGPNYSQGLGR